jgi:hypothetical protein
MYCAILTALYFQIHRTVEQMHNKKTSIFVNLHVLSYLWVAVYCMLSSQHGVYGSVQSYDWLKCITWQPDIIHIPRNLSVQRDAAYAETARPWSTQQHACITCERSIIDKVNGFRCAPSKKVKRTKKICGYIKCHDGNILNIYRRNISDRKKPCLLLLREVK